MIDPNEIFAACMAAHQCGQNAGSAMSTPFLSAIPSMSVASSSNASNVIGGVQEVGAQMLNHMSTIKSSIDQQVFAHQDQQRRQKSYDFQPDMSDLRATDTHGFPKELADEFFAPFMTKK